MAREEGDVSILLDLCLKREFLQEQARDLLLMR